MKRYFIALILILSLSAVGFADSYLLFGGQTLTYTSYDGSVYDITFVGVGIDGNTVAVKVNDDVKAIPNRTTETVGGLEIYVNSIHLVSTTNQAQNSVFLMVSPSTKNTIRLYPGWNMVGQSVFTAYEGMTVSSYCDFTSPFSAIYNYSSTKGWVLLKYPFDVMWQKDSLGGYFMKVANECSITYQDQGEYQPFFLNKGWNIIGGVKAEVKATFLYPEVRIRDCNYYPKLWHWNTIKNDWDTIYKTTQMQPGMGYWIYVYDEGCVLTAA